MEIAVQFQFFSTPSQFCKVSVGKQNELIKVLKRHQTKPHKRYTQRNSLRRLQNGTIEV
jgi:hypothetical protein